MELLGTKRVTVLRVGRLLTTGGLAGIIRKWNSPPFVLLTLLLFVVEGIKDPEKLYKVHCDWHVKYVLCLTNTDRNEMLSTYLYLGLLYRFRSKWF